MTATNHADAKETIEVLNTLIQTSEDGRKGFEAAADRAEDPQLKVLFQDRAQSCAAAVDELQQTVRTLGGNPEHAGTAAGTMHRQWVKARAAAEDSNLAVLEEVERGEDVAKAQYASALKAPLPGDVHALVEQQYSGVLANHDRVRQLRNEYRARA